MIFRKIAAILFALFLMTLPVHASEFGLNFHGFSYHFDRTDSNGREFREWNPGIGARFVLSESRRNIWLTEGGIYRNSTAHASKYLSGGYRFKLPAGFELGPSVVLYQSPDQNSGKAILAPLLVLSFRYQRLLLHVVPVPRYKDVNRNAAIGFYATFNLWKK
jgi:hypothetical protein